MVPWSHCRSTYLNEYLASVQIEKKKGISDGLFLERSYLPPSVSSFLYVFVRLPLLVSLYSCSLSLSSLIIDSPSVS